MNIGSQAPIFGREVERAIAARVDDEFLKAVRTKIPEITAENAATFIGRIKVVSDPDALHHKWIRVDGETVLEIMPAEFEHRVTAWGEHIWTANQQFRHA